MMYLFTRELTQEREKLFNGRITVMKKTGTLVGAVALTLAIGGGLILGNAALSVQAMTKEPETIKQETVSNTKPESTARDGAESEVAAGNDVSTVMKPLENGTTVIVEYHYDTDGAKATVTHKDAGGQLTVNSYEGEPAEAAIERFGGLKRNIPNRYVIGQPDESNVKEDTAVAAAVDAIAGKYALKQKTLDKFDVTAVFYTKYEDIASSVWWNSTTNFPP
jgi:hypothetical protein